MSDRRFPALLPLCCALTVMYAAGCGQDSRVGSLISRLRQARTATITPHARNTPDLMVNLAGVFATLEVDTSSLHEQLFLEERVRELSAELPRGRPLEQTAWLLTDAARHTPYHVTDCLRGTGRAALTVEYESRRPGQEQVRLTCTWAERYHSRSGSVAFLVRGFGFEPNQTTNELLSFPDPLTVSLPGHEDKSNWTARIAEHYRKEIVIEVPMENRTGASPGPTPIMVHHSEEQIAGVLSSASRNIPNFAGFCNVGGSRILEDTRATRAVLSQIKRLHGYFVDDGSSPQSLVAQVATGLQLPYRQLDAAISEKSGPAAIEEYMQTLVHRAHKTISVLVSAPATAAFADALTRSRELFVANGVRYVYVSDILVHAGE